MVQRIPMRQPVRRYGPWDAVANIAGEGMKGYFAGQERQRVKDKEQQRRMAFARALDAGNSPRDAGRAVLSAGGSTTDAAAIIRALAPAAPTYDERDIPMADGKLQKQVSKDGGVTWSNVGSEWNRHAPQKPKQLTPQQQWRKDNLSSDEYGAYQRALMKKNIRIPPAAQGRQPTDFEAWLRKQPQEVRQQYYEALAGKKTHIPAGSTPKTPAEVEAEAAARARGKAAGTPPVDTAAAEALAAARARGTAAGAPPKTPATIEAEARARAMGRALGTPAPDYNAIEAAAAARARGTASTRVPQKTPADIQAEAEARARGTALGTPAPNYTAIQAEAEARARGAAAGPSYDEREIPLPNNMVLKQISRDGGRTWTPVGEPYPRYRPGAADKESWNNPVKGMHEGKSAFIQFSNRGNKRIVTDVTPPDASTGKPQEATMYVTENGVEFTYKAWLVNNEWVEVPNTRTPKHKPGQTPEEARRLSQARKEGDLAATPKPDLTQIAAIAAAKRPTPEETAATTQASAEARREEGAAVNYYLPDQKVTVTSQDGGRTYVDSTTGARVGMPPNAVKMSPRTAVSESRVIEQQRRAQEALEATPPPRRKSPELAAKEQGAAGTGPWSNLAAAWDAIVGGTFDVGRQFPDRQDNRQLLRTIRQMGKAALLNSQRGAVWDQQNVEPLFPDENAFWANPHTEAAKIPVLIGELGLAKRSNNAAIASGGLTPEQVGKLVSNNLLIDRTLAMLGGGEGAASPQGGAPPPAERVIGQVYQGTMGPMRWLGNGWEPVDGTTPQ